MEIEAGTIVANRYRILRPLGRGGMGEVFAAENMRTGRLVAIKLLHSDAKAKRSAVERFKREARASGVINSDHVTQVLDVEEDQELGIVLVFELLEGESLIERLKRTGPIPFEELWSIIEQVWIGLADAHHAGIIHRDLKPSNVYLERRPDGKTRVKILDFGISKLPKEMEGETLTEMGQSLGTFSFMPPEQIGKAKTVDHRADIYACTTMIYQSLTGQLPYVAKNVLVMVELKAKEEPRRLADAVDGHVDPRLEAFVAKGLARNADGRFQTAVEALAAWRELRPRTSMQEVDSPRASTPIPANPSARSPASMPTSRSQAPVSGPRGTVQLEAATRPDAWRPESRLPVVNEPTSEDDTAATLAMPMARLLHPNAPPQAKAPAWPAPAPSDPRISTLPADLRATTPLQQPQPGMGQPAGNSTRPGPYAQGSGYPNATTSGTYGAPSQGSYGQHGYAEPQQQQGGGLDRTQVYAPQQHGMTPPAQSNPQVSSGSWPHPAPMSMPEQPSGRRWLPLVLGAIAFALIGFAIVGTLLYLTGGH
ncbi:serine/threonine protein kinase [Polyangium aurulentum]|uniref:serine/threonine protein kinase n=1 Tax=Polyangium aurulentum TaxID=2567896 RepID=UPI0010AE0E96|nr:serine/threonine-protein kinase [Polyangium aurulentum]UQA61559.1 protein kinase [Polyangium aurulentum]